MKVDWFIVERINLRWTDTFASHIIITITHKSRKCKIAARLNNLGVCYINKEMPSRAEPIYDEALRLNPQYTPGYFNRSTGRGQLQNLNGADEDASKAQRLGSRVSK
ncbi:MAG: tetratricopeptide repeat protein [Cyanobacteria bacterium SZAS TMP-1]|nr:tetratricopeptide repeat protein [Cyanobacteria bacterium SZAS TMP-1]